MPDPAQPRASTLWLLWTLWGLLLLSSTFTFELDRTQEARVLETARTMVGRPLHDWLVPVCNGNVRLQKPPLAYWLSAACFTVFGVSEWAGRLPAVIAGWAMVGLAYAMGRRLFDSGRAALAGAAILAGSFLFVRFIRFAETDGLAAAFVLAAAAALTRAADQRPWSRAEVLAHHAAAAAIALAVLVKGPPAAFALFYLLALAWARSQWRLPLRFLLCGAPLTAAALALPWFIYVARQPDFRIIADELSVIAVGRRHPGPFWEYVPLLFKAPLPWIGLAVLAAFEAAKAWRSAPPLRALILWSAMMFIALSATPQKQEHYLLPLAPPLALLAGWVLQRSLFAGDEKLRRASAIILGATCAVVAAGALATPLAFLAREPRRGHWADAAVAVLLLAAMSLVFLAWRRRGLVAGWSAALLAAPVLWVVIQGPWYDSLEPRDARDVAAALRERYRGQPLFFYRRESLDLVFYLGQTIPVIDGPEDLARKRAAGRIPPGALVLAEPDRRYPPPGTPIDTFDLREDDLGVYRLEP